jgi:hypothetical protein
MSRAIKFRIWDEDGKNYIAGDWSISATTGMVRGKYGEQFTDLTAEQFTGLLDKSGVEIYEGDIVQLQESYVKPIVVYWNVEMTGFYPLLSQRAQRIEVVGNIHDNPELLTK